MSKYPLINFFKGHPTKTLLPREQLANGFSKVLLESDYSSYDEDPLNQPPLTYGTDPGNLDVRKTIAKWSDVKYGREHVPTDAESINLTGGASYGIANILTSATDSDITKRVFVVSPTYYLINFAFIDAGFADKISAVKETPGGEYEIDLDDLEAKLIKYNEDLGTVGDQEINIQKDPTGRPSVKKYRFVIYLVPTYSNPGGLVYSFKTRSKLIELSRKYDILIISDDVYDFLNYGDDQDLSKIPKFVQIDRDTLPENFTFGNTVSNSSFSKLIAPGLRVGYQETVGKPLALQLASTGANKSGGTPGQLNSFVVQTLIKNGDLDKIINNFKGIYRKRAQVLIQTVQELLPEKYTKLYGGDGGYFLWVEIKADNVDTRKINKLLADEYNVVIPDGDNFEVNGDEKNWGQHGSRLCVSLLNEDEIKQGIQRWREVLEREHPELF